MSKQNMAAAGRHSRKEEGECYYRLFWHVFLPLMPMRIFSLAPFEVFSEVGPETLCRKSGQFSIVTQHEENVTRLVGHTCPPQRPS